MRPIASDVLDSPFPKPTVLPESPSLATGCEVATPSTELQIAMTVRDHKTGTLLGNRTRRKPIRRHRRAAEQHERISADQWASEESRSLLRITAMLMTLFFFYASAIPLKFSAPDFSERLATMVASTPWERGRLFDWTANILAFIPLGFAWAGAGYSLVGRRSARSTAAIRSALGCLILACLAEFLQLWLPMRVPSFRDIVALEAGAIIGCGIWLSIGPRATLLTTALLRHLPPQGRDRYSSFKWPALLGFLFCSLLAMNIPAGPAEWFEIYRHRAFPSSGPHSAARFASGMPLLVAVVSALGIWACCRLCELAISRYPASSRLRTFQPHSSSAIGRLASGTDVNPDLPSASQVRPKPANSRAA
jgi:VanZ family protein